MLVPVLLIGPADGPLSKARDDLSAGGFRPAVAETVHDGLRMLASRMFHVVVAVRDGSGDSVATLARARAIRPESVRVLATDTPDFELVTRAVNEAGVTHVAELFTGNGELMHAIHDAAESYRARRLVAREHNRTVAEKERLQQHTADLDREIRKRTMSLLRGLVGALDLRDSETQWHSWRVARYARRIGLELGFAGDELAVIERGALLHDIGKIGIRDSVLLKPSPLSRREWIEMRKHPDMGYRLLETSDFLSEERLIVLHHQERFDGTGYPAHLKGEEISIGARIFAVADTLDAMTSDRPYRKALPYEAARTEIEACASSQFDPKVVEAFLAIHPSEWEHMRNQVELSGEDADLWAARLARLTPLPNLHLDDLLEAEKDLGYWDE